MWHTYYVVSWMTANGVWLDMPRCDSPSVAAEIVQILLRVTKQTGEFVKVSIAKEQE